MNRLENFIVQAGITAHTTRVPSRPGCSWARGFLDKGKEFPNHAHYIVYLKSDQCDDEFCFFYSVPFQYPQSAKIAELRKVPAPELSLDEVMLGLLVDAQSVREVRDVWDYISEMGLGDMSRGTYSWESRTALIRSIREAHDSYQGCINADNALHSLLGPSAYWAFIHMNEDDLEEETP